MSNGRVVNPGARGSRPSPQATNRGPASGPTARKQAVAPPAKKAPKKSRGIIATVLSLAVAPGCILLGQYVKGGDISSILRNGWALTVGILTVGGGVLGSCVLFLSLASVRAALRDMRSALFRSAPSATELTERLVNYSQILRTEGQTALQPQIEKEPCSILATGLTMIVSNIAPEAINTMLERALPERTRVAGAGAEVFERAVIYLPRLGILVAIAGLSYAATMRSDPAKVGFGIAIAMAASVYGLMAAFLAAYPIAKKIRTRAVRERELDKLAVVGIRNIRLPAQALRQVLAGGGNPAGTGPQSNAHLKVGGVNAHS